jgi:glyceraldehyde 3-phosphate dehydrogenase
MAKVAINGLGRIGRAALKIILDTPQLELTALNDLIPIDSLAYLLKYDSVYGRYGKQVTTEGDQLVINGSLYRVFDYKAPEELPWGDLQIDLVFECTGVYRKKEGMQKHLQAGAKKVILSAPEKTGEVPTIVHGVNSAEPGTDMISCASCTTNCITPVVEFMARRIGIEKATMTTIHAYTSSQTIVDGPRSKWRRGRAAAVNFVPTSTGAAKATTKVLTELDGIAVRGPVPAGSVADMVFITGRETSESEINDLFREESRSDRYNGILGISDDPIVSSDRRDIIPMTGLDVFDRTIQKDRNRYLRTFEISFRMIHRSIPRMFHAQCSNYCPIEFHRGKSGIF